VIKRERSGIIKDLKLRKEGEKSALR